MGREFRAHLRLAVLVAAVVAFLAVPVPAQAALRITEFWAEAIPSAPNDPQTSDAASHPDSTVHMRFGGDSDDDDVKDIIQHFPSGIIPNPYALPQCTKVQFEAHACPASSQLGTTSLTARSDTVPGPPVTVHGEVYNIEVDPPFAGGLGFVVAGNTLAAPFTVRSATHGNVFGLTTGLTTSLPDVEPPITADPTEPTRRDYGLTGVSVNVPRNLDLGLGLDNITVEEIEYTLDGTPDGQFDPDEPYLTTTTACLKGYPKLEATSWEGVPGPNAKVADSRADDDDSNPATTDDDYLQGINCEPIPYDPTIDVFDLPLDPLENLRTDTPSRYDIGINIPEDETPLHQSYTKRTSIWLPEGTALSPAAAQGLGSCSDSELGIGNQNQPNCPEADIGDVHVVSKNVKNGELNGDFYLLDPTPGHNFRVAFAFKIVDGLWIKRAGETFADPDTGRLRTVFDELPMLPFERFTVKLRGGDRAVLVNPHQCGTYAVTSQLTPWKGAPTFPDSYNEHPSDNFAVSYDGAGGPCPDPFPFNPTVSGTTNPLQGGAYSKLFLTLTSPDRDQLVKTLTNSLPPGLAGGIAGIPLCPADHAAAGTCAEESRIGSIDTSVGSGGDPLELPGSIYIADPVQGGEPASLSIVVPNKAGPFDFGNTVLRARIILRGDYGLDVALVDDLPRIVEGVPIRLRTAGVSIDRDNFIRNPTSCAQQQLAATFTSREGAQVTSATPYQATNCEALPFSPKLRFQVRGEVRRNGHPTLDAILTQPDGQANIAKSVVVLPDVIRPELAALQRPGGLCQEGQAATRSCPSTSQVGVVTVTTPLLPEPLSGPVYIVQHAGSPLPKLVLFLDGRVSIKLEAQNGFQGLRIVNTFNNLPDLPVSSFKLTINGGTNGVLKNFKDLCDGLNRGDATFTAHSGKTFTNRPLIETPLNTPGCVSTAAPRASLTLKGVRSGRPVLSLRVRRGPSGEKLRSLRLKLPRSLKVNLKKARKGTLVRGSRKLKRSQWRLSRKGVLTLRRLPRSGFSSIRVVLKNGTLKPSAKLRRDVRKRKAKNLRFRIRVADVKNRRFNITLRVRPRS
jgi:nitrite reductase/ring-hydroxylating ferredoxin subunit